jgi:hypothetical protein
MCQCILCDCWWLNFCGACAGLHHAHGCCSYWLCKPAELMTFDPYVCHCCECDGIGSNHCCYGGIFCAPPSVKNWSHFMALMQLQQHIVGAMPPGSARAIVAPYPHNVYIG